MIGEVEVQSHTASCCTLIVLLNCCPFRGLSRYEDKDDW